jgi:hypothetical protein
MADWVFLQPPANWAQPICMPKNMDRVLYPWWDDADIDSLYLDVHIKELWKVDIFIQGPWPILCTLQKEIA